MKLSELIDISQLQELCESFHAFAGVGLAVIDVEGIVLIAVGWQEICTCYHRVHPITALRCRESDTVLAAQIEKTQIYNIYKCQNGLVDVAMPIKIGGEHIANLFFGQFFLETPDREFFACQAEEFGFNKTAYLEALGKVPILSEQRVKTMAAFLARLSCMIGEMGLERKGLQEVNYKLLQQIDKHRLAEEKFAKIVHTCPDSVCIVREDGTVFEVNESFCQMSGFSKEEVIGKTILELGILGDKQAREHLMEELRRQGEVLNREIRFRCKDGSILHGLISVRTISVNEENCQMFFIRDITEQKLTEAELIRSERLYRTLIENIPVTVFRVDHNMRFIYANQAMEKDYGINNASVIGETWDEIGLSEKVSQSWRKMCFDVLQSGRAIEYEGQYSGKEGELRNYLIRVIPEKNEAGQIESLLSVSLDITEWKIMERKLLRLDRLNTVGEMAAAIGHEIRNPLTTVRGYLQVFQQRDEYARHKEQLKMMIEELDRANTIISEYLSLAKTKMTDLKTGNLNQVFDALFPLIQADAFHSGHQVQLNASVLPDIEFDEKELRQMVLNLVRNGLEAMTEGGIVTISTYQEENHVVFAVQDTGSGIPADVVDRIGTPFLTTKSNGTGLGLSVCYRIAERHNAKIEFSTGKSGTTFYVKFPVPLSQRNRPPAYGFEAESTG